MKKLHQPVRLIIQSPTISPKGKSMPVAIDDALAKSGIEVKNKTDNNAQSLAKGGFQSTPKQSLVETNVLDTEVNPWDMAHLSATALGNTSYIEPDLPNEYFIDRKISLPVDEINAKNFQKGKPKLTEDDYDPDWTPLENTIWHLDNDHSQLADARKNIPKDGYVIRIGHIDTGYSKTHPAIPDSLKKHKLQRSFIEGEDAASAHDRGHKGFLKNPYHGTGTGGILAGGMINIKTTKGTYNDYLGGAHFAEVISCRIAESVVLIKTNAFAEALNYLTDLSLSGTQIHVVSMSMGGAPSKVWADAVNRAYEAGITVVTAAGNNFAGLPTRHLIYPARFKRVIAACGVTYDQKPYYTNKLDEMQGCFGPEKDMDKAMSAYTPNTPWATEAGTISFSGAGTSSATPQIASAAAIYYAEHHEELDKLKPWQRVEAIRHALYSTARKSSGHAEYDKKFKKYYGNGILRAELARQAKIPATFTETPKDRVPWFPILATIFKAKPDLKQQNTMDMLNTELAQLVYNDPQLAGLIDDNIEYDNIPTEQWDRLRAAVIIHPDASVTLRKYLSASAAVSNP